MRSRSEIFDETSRKRGPPEPTDGLDLAKRQKLGAMVPYSAGNRLQIPPLTPGPHTIAELFTVTSDEALKNFDVGQLSEDLVVKIGITILQRIDPETLEQTVNVSRNAEMADSLTDVLRAYGNAIHHLGLRYQNFSTLRLLHSASRKMRMITSLIFTTLKTLNRFSTSSITHRLKRSRKQCQIWL